MRLFYDDALQASLMARDFGVKFIRNDDCRKEISWRDYNGVARNVMGFEHLPLYVHEDSYSIFEPQVCDVIKICHDIRLVVGIRNNWIETDDSDYEISGLQRILERNNTAFFTPKQEK